MAARSAQGGAFVPDFDFIPGPTMLTTYLTPRWNAMPHRNPELNSGFSLPMGPGTLFPVFPGFPSIAPARRMSILRGVTLILALWPLGWTGAAQSPADAVRRLLGNSRSNLHAQVIGTGGADTQSLRLTQEWTGSVGHSRLVNTGREAVRVHEVIVFAVDHGLAGTTPVYGEGFQMLSQTSGTLAQPTDVGSYTDRGHYRLPEPPGFRTVYGLLTLAPAGADRVLLGFTSCRRFSGTFQFNATQVRAVIDTEDLEIAPGQTWDLEELRVAAGPDRDPLYEDLATDIQRHHPRLPHNPIPTGWCSWYCFGPSVTAANITDNLDWIARNLPVLRYIQIDDGYQPSMGDWLETGKAFGGGVQGVLKQIRERGFEPALWVAPFIASAESRLFQEHPQWFVQDDQGKPLRSDKVGFGGWRLGPWYALDGTHPEAQKFLENLFRTLRQDWGCTYFKLDANYWGTLPGGHHYDPRATRVEAYRRGMEAIRRGSGDAVLLGCNHPLWPSLGLIHGSRSSLDIDRSWGSFASIGRENLLRGWQNGRLWWNDPDCVVLRDSGSKDIVDAGGHLVTQGNVPDNEYQFHATWIYATGGMLLSGDDLTRMTPRRVEMLRKLAPPTGVCARFADDRFEVGTTSLNLLQVVSVFNWGDQPVNRSIPLPRRSRLKELWSGTDLGIHSGSYEIQGLPGRSAQLIEVQPVP
jgi:alpha-galactosidase